MEKEKIHSMTWEAYMHEVSFEEGLAKKTIPLSWTTNNFEAWSMC